jgi:transglutaminase/protease-like cytokinesis protein 3
MRNPHTLCNDSEFFITDPEDHIYQHFPDDPKWQLLECPITLTEFINLPIVKSPFFNYGLKFVNHYDTDKTSHSPFPPCLLHLDI